MGELVAIAALAPNRHARKLLPSGDAGGWGQTAFSTAWATGTRERLDASSVHLMIR
jgi:hypothetical protein